MTRKNRGRGHYVSSATAEDVLNGDAKYVYDPEFHPSDYIKQSRKGLHKVHICCEWNISPHLFNKWKAKHPKLLDAYFIGQAAFQVYWIDFLKDHLVLDFKTTFNQRGWEQIMQYGELNTRDRMICLTGLHKKKTIKAKNKAVLEALCDQLISLSEAHQLQELINKQAKLDEVQDLLTKVQEIEAEYGKK
jgi:hypothetical protein